MFLVCFAYSGAFDACALLTPFLRCCFLPWGMAHLIIAYFLFSSLCKIERRGVVRIRIRSRVIRIRVRRACIRTIVRVTASSTDTETYHAERCRQLPNVAARLCCRTKIFHPPDGGVGRFRPRPRRLACSMLSKFALSYFLTFGDDGVFLKIAERRGAVRTRMRSRAIRRRVRRARSRTIARVTASSTDTETLRGLGICV